MVEVNKLFPWTEDNKLPLKCVCFNCKKELKNTSRIITRDYCKTCYLFVGEYYMRMLCSSKVNVGLTDFIAQRITQMTKIERATLGICEYDN